MYTVSFILFFIVLLTWFIAITKPKYYSKFIFVFTIVSFTFIAAFIDPVAPFHKYDIYIDLYRFFSDMDVFLVYGWNIDDKFLLTPYETIPIVKFLVYLSAMSEWKNMLPVISCLIEYISYLYLLFTIKKDFNVSDRVITIAYLMFISMNSFSNVISNIRMPVGMALFIVALYFDLFKRTSKTKLVIMYTSLLFVHNIFLIFIGFRLLLIFSNRYSFKILCITSLIMGALINLVDSSYIFTGVPYFDLIIDKIQYYKRIEVANLDDPLFIIITLLRVALCIYLVFIIRDGKFKEYYSIERINHFTYFVIIFTFSSYWNFHLFTRMGNFIVNIIPILYIFCSIKHILVSNKRMAFRKNKFVFYKYDIMCFIISLINFLYYCFSHHYRMLFLY